VVERRKGKTLPSTRFCSSWVWFLLALGAPSLHFNPPLRSNTTLRSGPTIHSSPIVRSTSPPPPAYDHRLHQALSARDKREDSIRRQIGGIVNAKVEPFGSTLQMRFGVGPLHLLYELDDLLQKAFQVWRQYHEYLEKRLHMLLTGEWSRAPEHR